MMLKYAIALAIVLIVAAFIAWAFLPARYLPGNRARHLRIRLHLRLHPGKGFAHTFSLWLRWGRLAALRRSGRIRRSLPLWYRIAEPRQHSVFLGRANYRHRLRVPLEEHLLVMAPPRTYKTAFLADVILRYPGPVIATTTKADIYALTAAVRAGLGPVHVFNPSTSAAWHLPSAGPRSTAARTRPPPSAARMRSRSLSRTKASKTAPSGPPKPATTCAATSTPPPSPATTCAPSHLGHRRRTARPRGHPERHRRPPMGAYLGRAPLRGPQDHGHRPDGHVKSPVLHGRPGAGHMRASAPAKGSTSPPSSPTAAPST